VSTQALITQMAQTAVCNRHHSLDQQLSRWLLLSLGPARFERPGDDAGADRQYARRAALHYVTKSGASAETAAVGHEGMVGIPLFMSGGGTPGSAVVTASGHWYRLERRALMREFGHAGALYGALLRYTQALLTQLAQTVACYRHHPVEQQLSRWLLTAADRLPLGELVMTQETRRQPARRASRKHHAGGGKAAGPGPYPLSARAHLGPRSRRAAALSGKS
jgi:hypothetical protein